MRYTPNFVELENCKFVPFDREAHIRGDLEDGFSLASAERSADRCEKRHNEEEKQRVAFALEKIERIKKYGVRPADRSWITTYR